jgi:hypothetical protein
MLTFLEIRDNCERQDMSNLRMSIYPSFSITLTRDCASYQTGKPFSSWYESRLHEGQLVELSQTVTIPANAKIFQNPQKLLLSTLSFLDRGIIVRLSQGEDSLLVIRHA